MTNALASQPKVNRHLTRQATFQALFEADFRSNDAAKNFDRLYDDLGEVLDRTFAKAVIAAVQQHESEIDEKILEAAPNWPIDQVAKVDKAVMRLAIAELLWTPTGDVPSRVVINEAVELAKKFGSTNSARFVNGVLGTLYRKYGHDT